MLSAIRFYFGLELFNPAYCCYQHLCSSVTNHILMCEFKNLGFGLIKLEIFTVGVCFVH